MIEYNANFRNTWNTCTTYYIWQNVQITTKHIVHSIPQCNALPLAVQHTDDLKTTTNGQVDFKSVSLINVCAHQEHKSRKLFYLEIKGLTFSEKPRHRRRYTCNIQELHVNIVFDKRDKWQNFVNENNRTEPFQNRIIPTQNSHPEWF